MGLYYEDFEIDRRFTSHRRTLTETDVVLFAGLSGDLAELHTNDDFARQTPYGQRIVQGALVVSVAIGLATRMNLVDDTILAFWGLDDVRFLHPVLIGDTIGIVKRVAERQPLDAARGLVKFETAVSNQRGQLVARFLDGLLIKRRPAGSAPR